MTPAERVAAIDLALAGNRPLVWNQDGVNFRAEDIALAYNGTAIQATVLAWTGSGANMVVLPLDNPYIIVNPPVAVADGTTTIVDDDGEHTVPVFRHDPLAAYKATIASTVLLVASQMGWS